VKRRTVGRVVALSGGDALLLARIRAGDDQALAAVYDQHVGVVYGLARRVARDEQLARDITQEVFTYLWEMPHRVDLSRGSLRTYLTLLAHRRAVDEVRRRRVGLPAETAAPLPEREDEPGTRVTDRATLLGMLPAEQRAAVRLAYFDGLTYVQVAKALGIPEETAKRTPSTAGYATSSPTWSVSSGSCCAGSTRRTPSRICPTMSRQPVR
jgi:RNA polymerase sigma-70 factor, ECF subfamily